MVYFSEFCLDREAGVLLRNDVPVAIRRKLWDALCLLLERPGELVAFEDLRDRIWRGAAISQGSVANLIYELRRVLDDDAAQPRFIETSPARGVRFIAPVDVQHGERVAGLLVGRGREIEQFAQAWRRVRSGERRLVVVAGEPGLGKTHLIHHFLNAVATADKPRVLVGRSVERDAGADPYLGAEAYLPVFDILDAWHQAERMPDEVPVANLLREHAPHWARQIAWAERRRPASALSAAEARPGRMMRELAAVFEAAAAKRPLVLVFEDLHWADGATIDLLMGLAARAPAASLLLVASFRPAEAAAGEHPVLQMRGAPRERLVYLDLAPLSRSEVRTLLEETFTGAPQIAEELLDDALRRSGGNPLLVLLLARLFVDQRVVCRGPAGWVLVQTPDSATGLPSEVEALVAAQMRLLSADVRMLLEAAAVAGEEFDATAVAAGLGLDVEPIDTEFRRQSVHTFLLQEVAVSSWPDGMTAGRFRFRHGLYREALYRSLPAAGRAQLHRRIGSAIERGFTAAPHGVVGVLAEHFAAAGDHPRAAEYLERAGLEMIARSAIREAAKYFHRALAHILMLPPDAQRWVREVRVRTGYGLSSALTNGLDTPEVRENYAAVDLLRRQISDPDVLFPTLRVFWVFELLRFGYSPMRDLSEHLREVAESSSSPVLGSLAASMAGTTSCFFGELPRAREQLELSIALCDAPQLLPAPQAWLADARVESRCMLAWVLWLLGEHGHSRAVLSEAQRLANDGGHESTRGLVLWFRSSLAQLDNNVAATRSAASELQALASESDMPVWLQIAALVRALADLMEGDPTALEHALESLMQTEGNPTILIARAYLLGQLALAYGRRGDAAPGLALVDMALARIAENGARVSEADLRRIRGELLEASGRPADADREFVGAIEVARRQGARTMEVRAATARVQLLARQQSPQMASARTHLARLAATFAPDSLAHDVRVARAWLDENGPGA